MTICSFHLLRGLRVSVNVRSDSRSPVPLGRKALGGYPLGATTINSRLGKLGAAAYERVAEDTGRSAAPAPSPARSSRRLGAVRVIEAPPLRLTAIGTRRRGWSPGRRPARAGPADRRTPSGP